MKSGKTLGGENKTVPPPDIVRCKYDEQSLSVHAIRLLLCLINAWC